MGIHKKTVSSWQLKITEFPLKKIREETTKPKFFNSSSHSAKAFADDLSVFSSSPEDHQSLLLTSDGKCSDLNLTLKPEKCVSSVFNGSKLDHTTTFSLRNGSTRNIADTPTKLLGRLIAVSTSKTKNAATSELENKILSALKRIDECPIRGEYKVWIWKNYFAPSLHFQLMVQLLKKESVRKIQGKVTKFIKSWLNLPKCCTLSSIFHPEVLNLPFLTHYQESAKLSLVSSVETFKDPLVKALLFYPEFIARNQFRSECSSPLQMARESISQVTESSKPPSVKTVLKKSLHKQHTDFEFQPRSTPSSIEIQRYCCSRTRI